MKGFNRPFVINAKLLIETKVSIASLQKLEKELKKKLMGFVNKGDPLEFRDGGIYYCESKGAKTFNRLQVLDFLEKRYGKNVAHEVDVNCTKKSAPRRNIYVKLKY